MTLDPHKAPDVFFVNGADLAQELGAIDVHQTFDLPDLTIITGVRGIGNNSLPVSVIVRPGNLAAIVLPGGSTD